MTMYQVLIADDERAIRNGLQMILDWRGLGFEIAASAQDGEEALEIITRNKIDLLLADIRMPGLDGLSLAEKIQELKPSTHVILISGYRDFEYARRAVSLGVHDYLLKPVDDNALQELLVKIGAELDQLAGSSADEERELVARLRQMIAQRYAENISLRTLALELNYNPAYLGRIFSRKNGASFRDELNLCRIRHAARLLDEGRLCAYEVAERVGYRDVNYFYRVFRENYGVTPGEYKSAR